MVTVVLATLMAVLAPVPAAAVVPGTNGPIVFTSTRDSPSSGGDIYVMNADGANPTQLTTNQTGDQPVFSPDGTRIAFTSARDGDFEIFVMNADGTNPTNLTNLTNNPAFDSEPDWGVRAAQQTATTTTLRVAPSRAIQGIPVFLLATVTPRNAAGTVQFKDGTTNIGAPVPVFGGFAFHLTSTLTQGDHTLTAEFTPTNPATSGPSTSSVVSLTVRSTF